MFYMTDNSIKEYNNITIIGLGRVGGFLAKHISELECVKYMTLIDYDFVVESNLKNSIYRKSDIGKYKIDCLTNIIHNYSDIEIFKMNCKYEEGRTIIPKSDLVIDCRDFVYDRFKEIDVRLYISSRYLIADCRQDVIYKTHYEGQYIDNLTKSDMAVSTFNFVSLIENNLLENIIDKKLIYKIDLDLLKKITFKTLLEFENKPQIITDMHDGDEVLLNFFENSEAIIKQNTKTDINLCLGSIENPLVVKTLPKQYINDENDLMKNILALTECIGKFNHYIVSPIIVNNIYYILLIPETGAA